MDYGAAPWAPEERQPGLWELPLWAVQDDGGGVLAWMDPGTTWGPEAPPEVRLVQTSGQLAGSMCHRVLLMTAFANARPLPPQVDNTVAYRRMFEASYRGNRAPVGLFLHSQMLTRFPQHQAQLNAFLEWALAQPHVWAVTVSEVSWEGGMEMGCSSGAGVPTRKSTTASVLLSCTGAAVDEGPGAGGAV